MDIRNCIGLVLISFIAGLNVETWTEYNSRKRCCEWTVYEQGPFGPSKSFSGYLSDRQVRELSENNNVLKLSCRLPPNVSRNDTLNEPVANI